MIRNLILLFVLGTVFIGCKSKKRAVATENHRPTESKETTVAHQVEKVDDGVYVMPEDTGEFVRYEIDSPEEYIETFAEIAQFEMKAYGIPASITLAQGLLESGIGRGELARKTNNHFGIKCHRGWQGDFDHHDDDVKGECFRKYNHPMYSYRDHSIFLTGRSRYNFLFDLPNDDYKKWAKGLRKAGYATDKRYPEKLIALIERYDLDRFDTAVVESGYGQKRSGRSASDPESPPMTERDPRTEASGAGYGNDGKSEVAAAGARYASHTVQAGDTLYSISKRYAVSVNDLKRWNYLYDNDLAIGQELTVKTENFNK
ncbi:glucosaminidase domain-containing protein [Pricia sp. S334]|uniref:Peptidoglycan hydrolase n=1 Tax=Pricia mediterranea TaxID=3076079 RepID=A0ABU3L516_9FLAO|nr:glucosaminidase domain-containing protein [Pricia sp. S334]MDT7828192.1 glucosaminidase domain-containing protein [Pricia sp. S334]